MSRPPEAAHIPDRALYQMTLGQAYSRYLIGSMELNAWLRYLRAWCKIHGRTPILTTPGDRSVDSKQEDRDSTKTATPNQPEIA